MGRSRVAMAVVAATVTTAACGAGSHHAASSSSPSLTSKANPVAPSPPATGAYLLSLSDLPRGWTQQQPVTTSHCGSVSKTMSTAGSVTAEFAGTPGVPVVNEIVAPGSGDLYRSVAAILTSCKRYSTVEQGKSVEVTVTPASFPTIGDESTAVNLKLVVGGYKLGEIELVVASKGLVLAFSYGDASPVNADAAAALARKAASKL